MLASASLTPTNAILRDLASYLKRWREYQALARQGRCPSLSLRIQIKRYEANIPSWLIKYCLLIEKHRPLGCLKSLATLSSGERCGNCDGQPFTKEYIIHRLNLLFCEGCDAIVLVVP